MRRSVLAVCCAALLLAGAARPGTSTKQRCDSRSPAAGSFADCFSGIYHGTGFYPSMGQSMIFRIVTPATLHANALWRLWVADSKRYRTPAPCTNANAIPYVGTFTFYGSGTFIGCSLAKPFMLYGYYRVKHPYPFPNDDAGMVLTHGPLSATTSHDNVVELVFSDPLHEHFAQPEVALGPNPSAG